MGLARKITLILLGILFVSGGIIGVLFYQTSYAQVDKAAGVELVGCANITTGLIDPSVVQKLAEGNASGLKEIQTRLNWTVSHKPIFKEAFIMSTNGTILAADQNLESRGYHAGDSFYIDPKDSQMIESEGHSMYSKVYTFDGTALKTGYGPIYQDNDPTKPVIALMAINFDASILKDRTWDMLTWPFVAGSIILVLTALCIMLVLQKMIKPLEILSARAVQMASGDLTAQPLGYKRRDEIGRLAGSFDLMGTGLRKLIVEVGETSAQVASSAQQLSASADESSKAGRQTIQIITELQSGSETQLASLKESTEAAQEMSNFIQDISSTGKLVADSASQAAVVANEGNEVIEQAVQQMSTMNGKVHSLSDIISDLGTHSQEISTIVEVITGIAEETHLLAINAAIEAARAGEHGRGFSVVASSVRKLSERSKTSAEQISSLIQMILQQMNYASETMKDTKEEVTLGIKLVQEAGESFHIIGSSALDTADSLHEVNSTLQKLASKAEQLVNESRLVLQIADTTANGAAEMSAAAEQQLAATLEVSASSAFLSDLSDQMHELVERFKV